jgi:SnoaL-like domain
MEEELGPMTVEEWIAAYGRAWVGRDPEAAVALFTEDAVYHSHPFREPHTGSEGIRDYWTRATSTQEELELRFGAPLMEGSKAVVEWWAIMRNEGAWITLPGALLLRFAADGRCEELREYWHVEDGRREPPPGWGE